MVSHAKPTSPAARAASPLTPLWTLLVAAAALAAGGCHVAEELGVPFATATGEPLDVPHVARAYPQELPVGEPLDIEVIRDGNAIRLDNRTTQRFENVELWLNHQYGAPLDAVPIGRGRAINIESFTNHFGESYPVGRFLRPELDRPLILADLVVDGEIRKLTVRLDENWRPSLDAPRSPRGGPRTTAPPIQ